MVARNVMLMINSMGKTVDGSERTLRSAIKTHKGKFIVVLLYALFVFIVPLYSLTPYGQKSQQNAVQALVTKNEDNFFRQYISFLQQKNVNAVYSLLTPETAATTTIASLEKLSAYFASTTGQTQVVDWNWRVWTGISWSGKKGSGKTYMVAYEIRNSDSAYPYLLVPIVAQDDGGGLKIASVYARKEKVSITQPDKFVMVDGVAMFFALLLPLFILYSAMRYLVKAQKPRWPMLLVILLVSLYVRISITDASAPDPLITVNFSVGVYEFLQKLWTFAIPLPLGAIYYYFVREKYESIPPEKEMVPAEGKE
jgi:hypothetical protein